MDRQVYALIAFVVLLTLGIRPSVLGEIGAKVVHGYQSTMARLEADDRR